jgi:prepilin-type N-terminal cleavage/methylation domain-containing protein
MIDIRRHLPPHPHVRQGFTLVELAIVLVIIGLIVGGIIGGRIMIENARMRSQISQIEQITTAVNAFRLKYNCLPGDCANAVALGLGSNASWHNGDGDGLIDIACTTRRVLAVNNYNKESFDFFLHLSSAGMYPGSFEGYQGEADNTVLTNTMLDARYAQSKYGSAYIIPTRFVDVADACGVAGGDHTPYIREGGNGFSLVGYTSPFYTEVIPLDDIDSMDQKVDDGLPFSGKIGFGSDDAGLAGYINAMDAIFSTCSRPAYATMRGLGCEKLKMDFLFQY